MSFRAWITLISLVLLAVVVVFGWPEIVEAWKLAGQTNLWILSLLIPVQILSYFATGGMIFSYLKSKGNLKDISRWKMTRISLELNFVNHILPSGGAAGFSYLAWVLHRHGVSPGRSTMSQVVRFILTFVTFLLMLIVSVAWLIIDHQINRNILLLSIGLAVIAIAGTVGVIYVIKSRRHLVRFSAWLTRTVNKFVGWISRGSKPAVVKEGVVEHFFDDLHDDFLEIRRDKRILKVPFIWALVANLLDVTLLFIAFWALGFWVNPAILIVAFGLSSIASVFSVTPGGAGVYEAIFIAFLATAGVPADVAIAGTLMARVSLLLGTIVFGYFFYQLTINKYGKTPTQR
jgi:uncharacterized protein (TIRG00374 family)